WHTPEVRQVMPAMRVESDEEGSKSARPPSASMTSPGGQAPSGAVVVGAWVVSTGVVVLVGCGSVADVEGAAASSTQAASTTSHTMQGTRRRTTTGSGPRSEEHTSELQSRENLVCRPLLDK